MYTCMNQCCMQLTCAIAGSELKAQHFLGSDFLQTVVAIRTVKMYFKPATTYSQRKKTMTSPLTAYWLLI